MTRKVLATIALIVAGMGVPTSAQAAPPTQCDGKLAVGTYGAIVVPAGADCVLQEGTIIRRGVRVKPGGSLKTFGVEIGGNVVSHGARFVRLIETNIGHNIHIHDTKRGVTIGSQGCRVDPTVGNNLMVDDTRGDVAICYMQVDNNIKVTDTGRRASVFHSCAGNNISVNRTERKARVKWSYYGNHLFMRDNSDNVRKGNTKGDCGL